MEKSALFQSFTPEELAAIGPFTRRGSFAKGAVIFHAGQQVAELGSVLSGSVHIEANDLWGNRSILGHVAAGEVFAETYALCAGPMLVDAVAAEACSVEFLRLPALRAAQAALAAVAADRQRRRVGLLLQILSRVPPGARPSAGARGDRRPLVSARTIDSVRE